MQGNSYSYCEYHCLPLYQCENGWRGTFFLQLLLSLNMNIHLENIQDTNKIFKQYWAGCCILQNPKYYDVLSCLSAAGAGFKKTGKEKYFSFCSRSNVQLLGNTLGPLVKITLGRTFCHYLGNSSSSLASCKEPTGRKDWMNFYENIDFASSHVLFQPTLQRQARSGLQTWDRQSVLSICLQRSVLHDVLGMYSDI